MPVIGWIPRAAQADVELSEEYLRLRELEEMQQWIPPSPWEDIARTFQTLGETTFGALSAPFREGGLSNISVGTKPGEELQAWIPGGSAWRKYQKWQSPEVPMPLTSPLAMKLHPELYQPTVSFKDIGENLFPFELAPGGLLVKPAAQIAMKGVKIVGKGAKAVGKEALTVARTRQAGEILGDLGKQVPQEPLKPEVGKPSEGVPKVTGEMGGVSKAKPAEASKQSSVPPTVPPDLKATADKFVKLSSRIRGIIYRTEALRKPVRAEQRVRMAGIAEERQGLATTQRMSAQRAGELPKAGFEPIADKFTPQEITQLHNVAIDAFTKGIVSVDDAVNASKALDLYMQGIQAPRKFELRLFREIYGDQFAESIQKSTLGAKVWRFTLDALGLLKANKSSTDISSPLRQGILYFSRHPLELPSNVKVQIKSIFNEKFAKEFNETLRLDPVYLRAKDDIRRYFAPFGKRGALSSMEETYMTRFKESLPWVKRSDWGFTNGLNKIRLDMARRDYALMDMLESKGVKINDADRIGMAKLTNWATGRGDFPKQIISASPVLNGLMFSARFVLSRLQLPTLLLPSQSQMVAFAKGNLKGAAPTIVQKEAAKTLVTFLGWGTGILSAASFAGYKLELDSRSSDLGKLIIGNTRVDIWAGFSQYIRFLRQMQSGERKVVATGEIVPIDRLKTLLRFGQSKSAPGFGLVATLLSGETYTGQEIEWSLEGAKLLAMETLVPMVLMDIYDAARIDGLGMAILAGGLSALGVGVSTYEPKEKGGSFSPAEERRKSKSGVGGFSPAEERRKALGR